MKLSKTTMSKLKQGTIMLLLLVLFSTNTVNAKYNTNNNEPFIVSASRKAKHNKVKQKRKQKKEMKELKKLNKKGVYSKSGTIIYSKASTESDMISTFNKNEKIKIIKVSENKKWYTVEYKNKKRYILSKDTTSNKKKNDTTYKGRKLTKRSGVCKGPSGKETYYNLRMNGVVKMMRNKGYSEKDYPYWVRDDGCKMLGKYIIVACNLKYRPKGTLVETSLGTGIVCDTGRLSKYQVDIAVNWI